MQPKPSVHPARTLTPAAEVGGGELLDARAVARGLGVSIRWVQTNIKPDLHLRGVRRYRMGSVLAQMESRR